MKNINKIFIIVTVFTATSTIARSQSTLSVQIGAQHPTGNFGQNSETDLKSGFAKTGYTLSINYSRMLFGRLGFITSLRYSKFEFDTEAFFAVKKFASQGYANPRARDYNAKSVLVGPFLDLRLGEKSSIVPYALIGLTDVKSPGFASYSSAQEGYAWVKKNMQLGMTIGLGYRYNMTRRIGVGLNLDYNGAADVFKDEDIQLDTPLPSDPALKAAVHDFSYRAIGVTAGLTFRL